jgi:hypothetical protein
MRFFVLKTLTHGQDDTEFSRTSSNIGSAVLCPQCGGIVGSLMWLPPYRGELELYGKDFGDVLEGPGGLLVTERFAEAFRAEGLTGLSGFSPVEITRVRRKRRGPKPGPPPRYLFVTPFYGQTALDLERSRLHRDDPNPCHFCRAAGVDAIDGLAIEAGTWGGEDIFRPRGLWGVILVSERFVRFAERYAMTHMAMIPIDKYVWDPLDRFYSRSDQEQPPNKG